MERAQSGFTLIEAMVSVAILSIGFAGLYATMGASVTLLNQSNKRGQLDYFVQTVMDDVSVDIDEVVQYQYLVNGQLQPLPLNLVSPCTESTAACSNRNRWSDLIQSIVGTEAGATLEVHPICSPSLTTACLPFDRDVGVRRSAVLTVSVQFGRGIYVGRRIVDARG